MADEIDGTCQNNKSFRRHKRARAAERAIKIGAEFPPKIKNDNNLNYRTLKKERKGGRIRINFGIRRNFYESHRLS